MKSSAGIASARTPVGSGRGKMLRKKLWLLGAAAALHAGAASAGTETYTYDALGRVTQVVYSDGNSVSYSYDASGNRLGETTVSVINNQTATMISIIIEILLSD